MTVLGSTGCSGKARDKEIQGAAQGNAVKGARLETVKSVTIPEQIEVVGTVRAGTSAVVSARIPGTVRVLRVREGDRVQKGQLLAQLEAQENLAAAAGAMAGIDEAGHALDEALARKRLAETTFERYHRLFNEQAVTRQELDTRQTEMELAAQGVARAEARLKQAREGARGATTLADYTRVVAPISGIVTVRHADPGASVFPAQPLLTIEDEGSFRLELGVPESFTTRVRPGMPVQVALDALGASFDAKIAEVVPSADPASRTFIVKIPLVRKGLRSGMFGRGAIDLGTAAKGMLISKRGVVERGSLTSVWVVGNDGIARMRLVKAGRVVGERIEILSGLAAGERVVTEGVEKVSEGSRID
jgi:RND family efflux transporter MFP subunit